MAEEIGARCISFDDAGPREAAQADPAGFIDQSDLPLFIDEFQKAPAVLDAIKSRVDRERRADPGAAGMFLLTGSANVWATLRISESLVGRAERLRLWPLSQGEIEGRREHFLDEAFSGRAASVSAARAGRQAVATRVLAGGFPEMLRRNDPRRRARWTQSYLEMILERDVHDLTKRSQQLDELPRLLQVAATRTAGLLDLAGLGRDVGMKRDTAGRYLRLLELLYLVRRLPAWSSNLGQRLIKAPKLLLADTGLAAELNGYGVGRFEDLEDPFAGPLFENFVALELAKQASWSGRELKLHHFRTAGGREVDLLIEDRDGAVVAIETKLGATPMEEDFRALVHLRDQLGDRFCAGIVIGTGTETLPFGDRLWAAPASALWQTNPT